jgi:predicted N-acetyltransferase YhbS
VLDQVMALRPAGFGLYELGRGIVRPGYQGAGVMRGLIEFGIACAARAGPAAIIGSCLPGHVAFYARHGFVPLPGASLESFPSVGQDGYVLIGRSDRLPEPTRAHVSELLAGMGAGAAECVLPIGRRARARCLLAAS